MNSVVAPVIRKAAGFRTLVRRCHWAENVSQARLGLIRLFIGHFYYRLQMFRELAAKTSAVAVASSSSREVTFLPTTTL
jgi:hypothetical protein